MSINQSWKVRIDDLLGRGKVEVNEFEEEVREAYAGKRILVTGAGGSIGSELVRQLLLFDPDSVALLDKDENSVYELEQELHFRRPGACIEPLVADIRDRGRLDAIFERIRPQILFHAAAYKHVPLMEKNPCEAVLNNVYGTQTLLETCRAHGVELITFISTDKAVRPTSVMGATKRLGELLVQASAKDSPMISACVRFGNVMGSRGSVIPLFQKQIANGGPITVTHPDVLRFFMTIPEAVRLVLCAASLGRHGDVYVLDMGDPRSILDLAREMIRLSGLEPEKDIEISITGLRPGEKLVEELVMPTEDVSPTRFKKLIRVGSQPIDCKAMLEGVGRLVKAAKENDPQGIYDILGSLGLDLHRGGNHSA